MHHEKILKKYLPKLKKHLDRHGIDTTIYTLKWFFQCFLDRVSKRQFIPNFRLSTRTCQYILIKVASFLISYESLEADCCDCSLMQFDGSYQRLFILSICLYRTFTNRACKYGRVYVLIFHAMLPICCPVTVKLAARLILSSCPIIWVRVLNGVAAVLCGPCRDGMLWLMQSA